MSTDVTSDTENTFQYENVDSSQPKSGKKFCLLGGCGCLILMLVAAIAIYFVVQRSGVFQMFTEMQQITAETMALASSSEQVQEAVGSPVKLGQPRQGARTENSAELIFPVSGPDASGEITVTIRIGQDDNGKFFAERESMILNVDGQQIDLDPEKDLIPELDIDLGD